ncbi:hypothetical protein TNCV_1862391 [Trichonephila clavipes]|nr:hypothetical protein TNCV_1862391 [Trichonephila clavipes]
MCKAISDQIPISAIFVEKKYEATSHSRDLYCSVTKTISPMQHKDDNQVIPNENLDFFKLLLELIEHCSPIQSFGGVVPDTTLDAQPVATVNELIPVVHCFTVWKLCEALDLKDKFVPLPGATDLPQTPHRYVDQTVTVPVVGSFSVRKICQALDLPATYEPQLIRTTVFRKPHKPVPVVQSIAVFELCKALDITVKLAPQ